MQDLIASATELLVLGMGTVVVFLAILVATTSAMSAVVSRMSPDPPPPPPTRRGKPSSPTVDPRVRRAIELAVARYRQEH